MPIKTPKTKKAKKLVVKHEMEKFKEEKLHSGKNGKIVTNPKQAIAISLSLAKIKPKRKVKTSKKK